MQETIPESLKDTNLVVAMESADSTHESIAEAINQLESSSQFFLRVPDGQGEPELITVFEQALLCLSAKTYKTWSASITKGSPGSDRLLGSDEALSYNSQTQNRPNAMQVALGDESESIDTRTNNNQKAANSSETGSAVDIPKQNMTTTGGTISAAVDPYIKVHES